LELPLSFPYLLRCHFPLSLEYFVQPFSKRHSMAGPSGWRLRSLSYSADAARKQGRIGGRRPKLSPNQQVEIVTMVSTGTKTAADAARLFNVHPATVSRLLASAGAQRV
jgi:hypothetical protein